YGEAIAAYQAVLKRDPKNVDAMTHLALIVAIGGGPHHAGRARGGVGTSPARARRPTRPWRSIPTICRPCSTAARSFTRSRKTPVGPSAPGKNTSPSHRPAKTATASRQRSKKLATK